MTKHSAKRPQRKTDEVGLLAGLGVYGMEAFEVPILGALTTGEPLLFIGSHGTAKTTLCGRLAGALGLRFWAYDASKALFEDLIGFPDPASLAAGEVRYAPTPLSVWDKEFVLVDELSRADAGMQNKWLEVILDRRVMGKSIEGLRQVVAAMNPPEYLGAGPLDAALAGRFATVLVVPEVSRMDDGDVRRVIGDVSGADRRRGAAPADDRVAVIVAAARARLDDFPAPLATWISDYVMVVFRHLAAHGFPLDGRRLSMIGRALAADLCVLEALKRVRFAELACSPAEFGRAIKGLYTHHLPWAALDAQPPAPLLMAAHQLAAAKIDGARVPLLLPADADPIEVAEALLRDDRSLPRELRRREVSRVLGALSKPAGPDEAARQARAIELMAIAVCEGRGGFTIHEETRILSRWQELMEAPPDSRRDLEEVVVKVASDGAADLDPRDPLDLHAMRVGRGSERLREGQGDGLACAEAWRRDRLAELAERAELAEGGAA